MKLSIITPEHDPDNLPFLLELYESIRTQTYTNWEWVLFLNSKCTLNHIPDIIKKDNKVIIVRSEEQMTNVGEIKNKAFHLGTGDVLVEVDHDDIITPNCLEELYKAFQDPEIGFVYSDNAVMHMKDEFLPYDSQYGWTCENFYWHGKELISMHSFEPSSHSLGFIWYAPDHVRA